MDSAALLFVAFLGFWIVGLWNHDRGFKLAGLWCAGGLVLLAALGAIPS